MNRAVHNSGGWQISIYFISIFYDNGIFFAANLRYLKNKSNQIYYEF
jgi:hypothetical protein